MSTSNSLYLILGTYYLVLSTEVLSMVLEVPSNFVHTRLTKVHWLNGMAAEDQADNMLGITNNILEHATTGVVNAVFSAQTDPIPQLTLWSCVPRCRNELRS